MKLNETPIEKDFRVADVREEEKILRRLEALGILEGTRVRVLNRKRNGATIIKVRGSDLELKAMNASQLLITGDIAGIELT